MTTVAARPDQTVTVLLPTDIPLFPPATRRALLRTLLGYGALWLCGVAALALGASDRVTTFALGIALPGGGLFATGHPAWGAVAVLGMLLAVFVWWAAGPTVLPPLAWALTASLPLALLDGPDPSTVAGIAVLATVPALVALAVSVHAIRHASQRRRGAALNQRLAQVPFAVTGAPSYPDDFPVVEHSDQDLRRLRTALDLALQPLDAYEGFTHIDQFREGALRYQLNALSYGLSMSQFTRTPAFRGYLAEAQRNTIDKMLQRRVWGYWPLENAWGNLRRDKEPIPVGQNVMLTGFFGLQVGMYTALNDDRYTRPGSLTFRWDESTVFPHDLPGLAANVRASVSGSPFSLYPCEPNWIYTICNTFGLNTVLAAEQQTPTGAAEVVRSQLRTAYESEFLRPDGRIVGVRSAHLGLSWNFWASPSVQLATTYWLNPGMPDLAQRTWWLIRDGWLRVEDGRVSTPRSVVSRLDPGNYKLGTDTFTLAVTTMAAREIGDEETALAAEATLTEREQVEERYGAERVSNASGLANSYLNLGRFGRRSGLRDLVAFGPPEQWRDGPVLEDAAYPDVLVARAVSDGAALDLVLVPGNGPVRTTLTLGQLRPGASYDVRGTQHGTVVADYAGRAQVEIDLGARTQVRVMPAG
ncbi:MULTISPECIES: linalool dehydratase/isomerase domain-containing protein [unclassified Nocardioides]|uniref:linalool dehydratase/isomerase domain-containing protein n=1 Tax=unclassified Nocardioides TaxID=2615069 RepID=UPI0006F9F6AD|nr:MULTISPECIES: hypothetical protein [unclassified Nocardioides]KRA37763.1 hypothetical protein ASD81_03440 [Nocardioides sp. Root614]KRA91723.1 hypothetical protein ASD84_03705 [Nocardioides sp. Root682]